MSENLKDVAVFPPFFVKLHCCVFPSFELHIWRYMSVSTDLAHEWGSFVDTCNDSYSHQLFAGTMHSSFVFYTWKMIHTAWLRLMKTMNLSQVSKKYTIHEQDKGPLFHLSPHVQLKWRENTAVSSDKKWGKHCSVFLVLWCQQQTPKTPSILWTDQQLDSKVQTPHIPSVAVM